LIYLPLSRRFLTQTTIYLGNMPNFVSYLRVSTLRQGQSGLGIDAQRTAVKQYLGQVGGTLLQEYVEIESGSSKARPVLVQSISLCRSSKAVLVIAKLDRLARNVAFVSSLMESGVEFVAVDAPYANRLMIHILAAFAEHERTLISERTKAALLAAKARGVQLGANGAKLAQVRRSQACQFAETMRPSVVQLIERGASTLIELASGLNAAELPTREGARWSPGTVHRLLSRMDLLLHH
jgi:DNA invertase Pin-like site-specific DNA recombinase